MIENLIRTGFGDRVVVAELDIPFTNGATLGIREALNTANVKPEIISIQFQQNGANAGTEIGKYSLKADFDLGTSAGNIITHLAQLTIAKNEIDGLQVLGLSSTASNMHIVCYG
jgi:hypothetical protein